MNFEDMFNFCKQENNNEKEEGHYDYAGGFQDMDPGVFTLLGTLVANAMAGNLPLNMQAALGNWFLLLGQSMVTFSAQQAYFESGPGRCYSCKNKNITNPFHTNDVSNISNISPNGKNNNSQGNEELSESVKKLLDEVNGLKEEIKKLKNKK